MLVVLVVTSWIRLLCLGLLGDVLLAWWCIGLIGCVSGLGLGVRVCVEFGCCFLINNVGLRASLADLYVGLRIGCLLVGYGVLLL